jgi:hypothetical protein
MSRRVAVTGMAGISPIGNDWAASASASANTATRSCAWRTGPTTKA